MATLKEYFDKDFTKVLNAAKPFGFEFEKYPKVEILARVHLDFDSNTKYVSCYLPEHPSPISICVAVLENLEPILATSDSLEIQTGMPGEKHFNSKELIFSGRVFFYSATDIPEIEIEELSKQAIDKGIYAHYRGPKYAAERSKIEKPMAFISHDTRDKDIIARPIALGLSKLLCPVWFDEYSLKVGDPLRESIEKGLKECKKCILILSKGFLSNEGWTKVEFNSIFTREILESKKLVLPVWYDVEKTDVYEYSSSLVNIKAIKWGLGEEEVVRQLYHAIEK